MPSGRLVSYLFAGILCYPPMQQSDASTVAFDGRFPKAACPLSCPSRTFSKFALRREAGVGSTSRLGQRHWMHQRLNLTALLVDEYDTAISFFVGKLGFELRDDTAVTDGKR